MAVLKKMKIKIVGISGSPREGANTDYAVKEALKAASGIGNVKTEFVSLANKEIHSCKGCFLCLAAADSERLCIQFEDDMQPIAKKMFNADGIIIGSPVYVGSVYSKLKALLERVGLCGARNGQLLRNKVGAAIAVGGSRSFGTEWTALTIHYFFHAFDMIVVGVGPERPPEMHACIGGIAQAGFPEKGYTDVNKGIIPVTQDYQGLASVRGVGMRVADLAKIIKHGIDAVPESELAFPPSKQYRAYEWAVK